MKNYNWLFLPGVIVLLLPVIAALFKTRGEANRQRYTAYYDVAKKVTRVLEYKTAEPVANYIDELTAAFNEYGDILEPEHREAYFRDIAELKEHLADIEREHWEKRAEPHLQTFADDYEELRTQSLPPAEAQRIKRECIREWQRYYGTSLDQYRTTIHPKQYFREWMAEDYDPCMDDHGKLDRRLDKYIRENS